MKTERTTVDLRNELFEMLIKLKHGKITYQEAIAGSKLAAQINESIKTDVVCARVVCGKSWNLDETVHVPSIEIT